MSPLRARRTSISIRTTRAATTSTPVAFLLTTSTPSPVGALPSKALMCVGVSVPSLTTICLQLIAWTSWWLCPFSSQRSSTSRSRRSCTSRGQCSRCGCRSRSSRPRRRVAAAGVEEGYYAGRRCSSRRLRPCSSRCVLTGCRWWARSQPQLRERP